jgi:hypothetical protein
MPGIEGLHSRYSKLLLLLCGVLSGQPALGRSQPVPALPEAAGTVVFSAADRGKLVELPAFSGKMHDFAPPGSHGHPHTDVEEPLSREREPADGLPAQAPGGHRVMWRQIQ